LTLLMRARERKEREKSVPIDDDPSARVRDKFFLHRAHSSTMSIIVKKYSSNVLILNITKVQKIYLVLTIIV
jgi:hypothetical protein